jgi:hypothetical protein
MLPESLLNPELFKELKFEFTAELEIVVPLLKLLMEAPIPVPIFFYSLTVSVAMHHLFFGQQKRAFPEGLALRLLCLCCLHSYSAILADATISQQSQASLPRYLLDSLLPMNAFRVLQW